MHQFTVLIHSKPHRVYVCLTVTCHLHFWQNGQDLSHATAVDGGGTDTKVRVCTESAPGEENSPAAPAGIEPRTFYCKSNAETTELSPLPKLQRQSRPCFENCPKLQCQDHRKHNMAARVCAVSYTHLTLPTRSTV